jgi:GWxTD domain-containing protein
MLAVAAAVLATPASSRARSFALYAQAYLDSNRTPAARVTAEVPFKSLVFFKKEGWYDARYEVYLTISPVEGGEDHTAVLQGHAVARSYEETDKIDLRAKSSRTFVMEPGTYRVSAALQITHTSLVIRRSVELTVPDFLATGIGFGSPVVLMLPPGSEATFARLSDFKAAGNGGDDEAETADLAAEQDMSLALFQRRPAVRFQLYLDDRAAAPLDCDLFYEVADPNQRQVLYGKRRVTLTGKDDSFILSFDVDDWDPGAYTINLRALGQGGVRDASASVVLNVDVTRAMLGRNFDETLEILSLIADREELRGLREASPDERVAAWSAFWKARDPDPTTLRNEALDEHLRRVRYVMRNFSTVQPGWRTDRGRIYIRHGAPDRIERATDSRYQGEYEIWRYLSTGRVYVFYDMFGLGDYRLVQGDMF